MSEVPFSSPDALISVPSLARALGWFTFVHPAPLVLLIAMSSQASLPFRSPMRILHGPQRHDLKERLMISWLFVSARRT
jgi:hypothetical protein